MNTFAIFKDVIIITNNTFLFKNNFAICILIYVITTCLILVEGVRRFTSQTIKSACINFYILNAIIYQMNLIDTHITIEKIF